MSIKKLNYVPDEVSGVDIPIFAPNAWDMLSDRCNDKSIDPLSKKVVTCGVCEVCKQKKVEQKIFISTTSTCG